MVSDEDIQGPGGQSQRISFPGGLEYLTGEKITLAHYESDNINTGSVMLILESGYSMGVAKLGMNWECCLYSKKETIRRLSLMDHEYGERRGRANIITDTLKKLRG